MKKVAIVVSIILIPTTFHIFVLSSWLTSLYNEWHTLYLFILFLVFIWTCSILLTILHFIRVSVTHPGFTSLSMNSYNDSDHNYMKLPPSPILNNHSTSIISQTIPSSAAAAFSSHCHICDVPKPPRTHHCRKCNRCVYQYDHHCHLTSSCKLYIYIYSLSMRVFWLIIHDRYRIKKQKVFHRISILGHD